jgi:EpsD family peptidyl-prolyl cis-trans isomerase
MVNVPYPFSRVKRFIVAAALVALAACDRGAASGQVVAVVNGEEITIPELNAEARARGLVIGNDRALRDRVLQDLIDRKLLVKAALDRQLDRTPDYLLAKRRSDEMLLAGSLVEALGRRRPSPTDQELAQFIAAHPYAFDKRALLSVDRITVIGALAPNVGRAVADAPTLDAAHKVLNANRVTSERRLEVWDSATISAEMADQLLAPGKDQTILLELPGQSVVANVVEAVPQPTPAASRPQLARQLLTAERSQQTLQSALQEAKSSATVRYQPRFAPL